MKKWDPFCFNSLQTGKCIQRINHDREKVSIHRVSIPFKRESVSKGSYDGRCARIRRFCFNSLQTGKCIQRPSQKNPKVVIDGKFQFPSNGKVYPKALEADEKALSAGFQFPSNGKVYPKFVSSNDHVSFKGGKCFNSLQTGKCIQRRNLFPSSTEMLAGFQFPSNGKVYPKEVSDRESSPT